MIQYSCKDSKRLTWYCFTSSLLILRKKQC